MESKQFKKKIIFLSQFFCRLNGMMQKKKSKQLTHTHSALPPAPPPSPPPAPPCLSPCPARLVPLSLSRRSCFLCEALPADETVPVSSLSDCCQNTVVRLTFTIVPSPCLLPPSLLPHLALRHGKQWLLLQGPNDTKEQNNSQGEKREGASGRNNLIKVITEQLTITVGGFLWGRAG